MNASSREAEYEDLTTDTWSSEIKDPGEKIQFLETYVNCPAEVLDTEYHIIYQDNSTGLVPGPSYWKVAAAIKINPGDSAKWIDDMEAVSETDIDMNWWKDLSVDEWTLNGPVSYYKRPKDKSYLVVYNETDVVLKYFYTD